MDKEYRLHKLKEKIEQKKLSLSQNNGLIVFGKGNPNAQILVIGEAPGAKEAESGMPFVGAAGKRLDGLLQTIGLTIDDVYIANILKYRPPKNRDPKMNEIVEHTPYLLEQIKIIQPKIIVTLGNFATKYILSGCDPTQMKKIEGIAQIHGRKHVVSIKKQTLTVFPQYHPAAMMYKPSLKPEIEKDFSEMKKEL